MQLAKEPQVPEDGGEALRAGFTAADCPFDEGDERFDAWNEQFDAAADETTNEQIAKDDAEINAADEDKDEPAERSVVKSEYRARYAEAGHPAHCGDELAVLLNNLCLTKKGIEVERLDAIATANDVDLSKYNRTTRGWQGRLRMTARNILAGKVFAADGILKAGIEGTEPEYRLSAEWMASRRKVKAAA
jgi:hypothetical protein